jgi:hypothetical protein
MFVGIAYSINIVLLLHFVPPLLDTPCCGFEYAAPRKPVLETPILG